MSRITLSKMLVLTICIALLLSFGIHEFIPHNHPHMNTPQMFLGIQLDTIMHGENKLWFLIALLALCLLFSFSVFREMLVALRSSFIAEFVKVYNARVVGALRVPTTEMLRRGIMHPKIYR